MAATLVEYALILYHMRNTFDSQRSLEVTTSKAGVKVFEAKSTSAKSRKDLVQQLHSKIDKRSLLLFPIVFSFFNVIYWSYYLSIS